MMTVRTQISTIRTEFPTKSCGVRILCSKRYQTVGVANRKISLAAKGSLFSA